MKIMGRIFYIPFQVKESMLNQAMVILSLSIYFVMGVGMATAQETGVRESGFQGVATETHLPVDNSSTLWIHDPAVFDEKEGDRVEIREVVEQNLKTVKLDNLVPPIHFGLGEVQISKEYIKLLQDVLDSMRDRTNLRLHFIGHADSGKYPVQSYLVYLSVSAAGNRDLVCSQTHPHGDHIAFCGRESQGR